MTGKEFDAAYRKKHRDYKSIMADGRRAIMLLERDGATVLIVESKAVNKNV